MQWSRSRIRRYFLLCRKWLRCIDLSTLNLIFFGLRLGSVWYLIWGKIVYIQEAELLISFHEAGTERLGSHFQSSLASLRSLGRWAHHLLPIITQFHAFVAFGSTWRFVPAKVWIFFLASLLCSARSLSMTLGIMISALWGRCFGHSSIQAISNI